MSFEVTLEEHPQYLAAHYHGTGTVQMFNAQHDGVVARCQALQLRKCLCDMTRAQFVSLSTTDRYFLGRGALAFGRTGIKVAVLAAVATLDPGKFGEIVAQNAGIQLQVFTAEAPALVWLLSA